MKVWIDIENPPDVLFFSPIIERLTKCGTKAIVTARDKSGTLALLKMKKLSYEEVTEPFKYQGRNFLLKAIITLLRAFKLFVQFFRDRKNIYLATNHGSRSHILAAFFLRIPVVVFDDYEHSDVFLYKKFVHKLFIPKYIPTNILVDKGIPIEKIETYPGFKEEIYLHSLLPDEQVIKKLGIDENRIIVTLRPPASSAHYYDAREDKLFEQVMNLLSQRRDVTVIILPRGKAQYQNLRSRYAKVDNFIILRKPVDSLSLIYFSDIVIGGGGTMNREAALIGTLVYSIFLGKRPSVDKKLKEQGKLEFINNISDLSKIEFLKKPKHFRENNSYKNDLVEFISKQLEKMGKEK